MEKEDKIDKLARMVADGFAETRTDIESLRGDMATKEDLSALRAEMATKEDLVNLRTDFDIMLDRHIGTFRKDYDELSARVKKLEEAMFK